MGHKFKTKEMKQKPKKKRQLNVVRHRNNLLIKLRVVLVLDVGH